MPGPIRKILLCIALMGLLASSHNTFASHIAGGGFTYRYLGDTLIGGVPLQKYEVTLTLYQDCITGVPEAIFQDNPAYFTLYEQGSNVPTRVDTNVYFNAAPGSGGSATMPPDTVNSPCGLVSPESLLPLCLLRKKFVKTYYLENNATGYVIVYQRCCRNSSILNVLNPGDVGITFFCNIPPSATGHNNSAVFNRYPPQATCNNILTSIDLSATDPDGDSLTYEFGNCYNGAFSADIKPTVAPPPPHESVSFMPPYSYQQPLGAMNPYQINTTTGRLLFTGNRIGRYLAGVVCYEWRNGVVINATAMEFQIVNTDCKDLTYSYKIKAGPDHTILAGESVQFMATGGIRYYWLPGEFLSNPYRADPLGVFTEPGTYTYIVTAETDSGCVGRDTVTVSVLDHSSFELPNAFTPNNDGRNDMLIPRPVGMCTLKSFRVFNRWGNLIYQTNSAGTGWDGKDQGTLQDQGVFSWSIEFTDDKGVNRTKSGNTVLLR